MATENKLGVGTAAKGATLEERLNNAILHADWVARPKAFDRIRPAVSALATHWVAYWPQRGAWQEPRRLRSYAQWYTRAYALFPPATRAKLVDPLKLDASLVTILREDLERMWAGNAAAVATVAQIPKSLADLGIKIGKAADAATKAAPAIATIAVVALIAYALSRQSSGRRA